MNDRKYVFHFRPKLKPKPDKHLALGRIPKPKPKVQIYVKIGGILLKFNVSNDLSSELRARQAQREVVKIKNFDEQYDVPLVGL